MLCSAGTKSFHSECFHVILFVILLCVYKVILGISWMATVVNWKSELCNRVR
jgi:hypothetical protein